MTDKHNLLCLVIPTIDQFSMNKYWLPSIYNLKDVSEFCSICLNFQKYPDDLVNKVVTNLEELGFKVYYSTDKIYEMNSPGMLQFNKIRNDTALLNPNCEIYCLTDDDFCYLDESINKKHPNIGIQYLRVIHYMLKFKNCGFILTGGNTYSYNPPNTIGPTKSFNNEWYATCKSLFLRTMRNYGYELFPEDSLELYGAREECILCASRLNKGLFSAKFGGTRIHHYEICEAKDSGVTPGYDEYGWLKEEIVKNNANKYIQEHYGVKMRGVHSFNVVREDVYLENGGIDHQLDREKYLIDYSDYSKDQLIKEINKMIGE